MISTAKFEDKVAITGVGASEIGRRLMRTPLSLTVEACERAVADAGLTSGRYRRAFLATRGAATSAGSARAG